MSSGTVIETTVNDPVGESNDNLSSSHDEQRPQLQQEQQQNELDQRIEETQRGEGEVAVDHDVVVAVAAAAASITATDDRTIRDSTTMVTTSEPDAQTEQVTQEGEDIRSTFESQPATATATAAVPDGSEVSQEVKHFELASEAGVRTADDAASAPARTSTKTELDTTTTTKPEQKEEGEGKEGDQQPGTSTKDTEAVVAPAQPEKSATTTTTDSGAAAAAAATQEQQPKKSTHKLSALSPSFVPSSVTTGTTAVATTINTSVVGSAAPEATSGSSTFAEGRQYKQPQMVSASAEATTTTTATMPKSTIATTTTTSAKAASASSTRGPETIIKVFTREAHQLLRSGGLLTSTTGGEEFTKIVTAVPIVKYAKHPVSMYMAPLTPAPPNIVTSFTVTESDHHSYDMHSDYHHHHHNSSSNSSYSHQHYQQQQQQQTQQHQPVVAVTAAAHQPSSNAPAPSSTSTAAPPTKSLSTHVATTSEPDSYLKKALAAAAADKEASERRHAAGGTSTTSAAATTATASAASEGAAGSIKTYAAAVTAALSSGTAGNSPDQKQPSANQQADSASPWRSNNAKPHSTRLTMEPFVPSGNSGSGGVDPTTIVSSSSSGNSQPLKAAATAVPTSYAQAAAQSRPAPSASSTAGTTGTTGGTSSVSHLSSAIAALQSVGVGCVKIAPRNPVTPPVVVPAESLAHRLGTDGASPPPKRSTSPIRVLANTDAPKGLGIFSRCEAANPSPDRQQSSSQQQQQQTSTHAQDDDDDDDDDTLQYANTAVASTFTIPTVSQEEREALSLIKQHFSAFSSASRQSIDDKKGSLAATSSSSSFIAPVPGFATTTSSASNVTLFEYTTVVPPTPAQEVHEHGNIHDGRDEASSAGAPVLVVEGDQHHAPITSGDPQERENDVDDDGETFVSGDHDAVANNTTGGGTYIQPKDLIATSPPPPPEDEDLSSTLSNILSVIRSKEAAAAELIQSTSSRDHHDDATTDIAVTRGGDNTTTTNNNDNVSTTTIGVAVETTDDVLGVSKKSSTSIVAVTAPLLSASEFSAKLEQLVSPPHAAAPAPAPAAAAVVVATVVESSPAASSQPSASKRGTSPLQGGGSKLSADAPAFQPKSSNVASGGGGGGGDLMSNLNILAAMMGIDPAAISGVAAPQAAQEAQSMSSKEDPMIVYEPDTTLMQQIEAQLLASRRSVPSGTAGLGSQQGSNKPLSSSGNTRSGVAPGGASSSSVSVVDDAAWNRFAVSQSTNDGNSVVLANEANSASLLSHFGAKNNFMPVNVPSAAASSSNAATGASMESDAARKRRTRRGKRKRRNEALTMSALEEEQEEDNDDEDDDGSDDGSSSFEGDEGEYDHQHQQQSRQEYDTYLASRSAQQQQLQQGGSQTVSGSNFYNNMQAPTSYRDYRGVMRKLSRRRQLRFRQVELGLACLGNAVFEKAQTIPLRQRMARGILLSDDMLAPDPAAKISNRVWDFVIRRWRLSLFQLEVLAEELLSPEEIINVRRGQAALWNTPGPQASSGSSGQNPSQGWGSVGSVSSSQPQATPAAQREEEGEQPCYPSARAVASSSVVTTTTTVSSSSPSATATHSHAVDTCIKSTNDDAHAYDDDDDSDDMDDLRESGAGGRLGKGSCSGGDVGGVVGVSSSSLDEREREYLASYAAAAESEQQHPSSTSTFDFLAKDREEGLIEAATAVSSMDQPPASHDHSDHQRAGTPQRTRDAVTGSAPGSPQPALGSQRVFVDDDQDD